MTNDLRLKLFRGFADPSRLKVLEGILDGPRCVSELLTSTGLSQPNLSMHLACLRDCGLVRSRRNGRFVYYELADPGVVKLLQAAERLLARVSKRIQACPRYEGEGHTYVKRTKAKR